MLVLLVLEVALILVFLAIQPVTIEENIDFSDDYTLRYCSFSQMFFAVTAAPQLLMMVWGVYLAYQVRNVPSIFNETKTIGYCIYNFTLVTLVIGPLVSLLQRLPAVQFVLVNLGLLYLTVSTLALVIVPKFLAGTAATEADSGGANTSAKGTNVSGAHKFVPNTKLSVGVSDFTNQSISLMPMN